MLVYIVAVASVNMGIGFALAVYLARQHRNFVLNPTESSAAASVTAAQSLFLKYPKHSEEDLYSASNSARTSQAEGPYAGNESAAEVPTQRDGNQTLTEAVSQDSASGGVESLRQQVQQYNDDLTSLESRVLAGQP